MSRRWDATKPKTHVCKVYLHLSVFTVMIRNGIRHGSPTHMRHRIAQITQLLRLPAICTLCTQYHQGHLAVCDECLQFITPLGPACRHCATPLPDSTFLVCGQCCLKRPAVDHVISAYRFEEPLRTLLHQFKYREGLYLSSFLTTLMLNAMPTDMHNTQCLIPVPMHPKRLKQRGFNQAAELAKRLAQTLQRPCHRSLCHKIINTAPQAGLNAKQRRHNLRHAFIAKPIPYQHVTLVDDLLTTGSTANELACVLKKQGAVRVDLWCCARAVS